MLKVNGDKVINILANKIAQLERELAISIVAYEEAQEEVALLTQALQSQQREDTNESS